MKKPPPNHPTKYVQTRELCARYSISSRTVDRWVETGVLPKPLRINHKRYWPLQVLENFERNLAKTSSSSP